MSNALGDRCSTKILTAEQIGSVNSAVDTAYITNIVPNPTPTPSDLLPLTLDKVNHRVGINNLVPSQTLDCDGSILCGLGDVICESGSVKTNKIDTTGAPGSVVEFASPFRGLKQVNGLNTTGVINSDFCRGDIVTLRPTGPAAFTLPNAVAGMNLTLVNGSNQTPRIVANLGNYIDGVAGFIAFPPGSSTAPLSPFIWNIVSPQNGHWTTSKS